MGTILVACPSCNVHCFAREDACPSCGAALRRADGSVARTAGAVLMSLSLVTGAAACGDDGGTGGGADGGAGQGASGQGGQGGFQAISAYGVGPGGGDLSSTATTGGGAGGAPGTGGAGGTGG